VALVVLEVVDEGREVVDAEAGRLEVGIILQHLRQIDQEVSSEIAVDDVLFDVDEIIDAGVGLHIFDFFIEHLVPGGGLELHRDAGEFLEPRSQHILGVVGRRRTLRDAADCCALVGLGGLLPPILVDLLSRRGAAEERRRRKRRHQTVSHAHLKFLPVTTATVAACLSRRSASSSG
jgi:hypothetical protein